MFIEERHEEIMNILKKQSRVEVQNLSSFFNVSEDTIRRDLRIMEDKGLVQKTHGGAILPPKKGVLLSEKQRSGLSTKKKEEIAKIAASFIEDDDSIFLEGSTTVARMIPYLLQKNNIIVITNSVSIAYDILNLEGNIKLYLIGGNIGKANKCANSIDTFEAVKRINVDKVFAGVCTISAEWGISTPFLEETNIQQAILESGTKIYLMVDSSKFDKKSISNVGPVKPEYTIITDSGIKKEALEKFNKQIKQGLKIIHP